MGASRVAWWAWGALLVATVLLTPCHAWRVLPEASAMPAPSPALEVWVDASATEGGDGGVAHPLRRLQDALTPPANSRRVHLAPGVYGGPFLATDGTALIGASAAVLTAPAGLAVLEAHGTVSLERLFIQGGTLGLQGNGSLQLSQVKFSGQRRGAVLVAPGGTLSASDSRFEASVSGGVGVDLGREARAELSNCTFEGPWQKGVEARAPLALAVSRTGFRGSVTALRLRGGHAELSDVAISEGRGPGLYVAEGTLVLHRVQVVGQEYALLTGTDAVVDAEELTSTRADRAGVGVVNSRAHFLRLAITSAGSLGGLQCVSSDVVAEGLQVDGVAGVGVFQRDGSLRLSNAVLANTREPQGTGGEGLQLRGGRASLDHLRVRDAGGACLLAAEGADVTLSNATLQRCHTAGLVAETQAHLTASQVQVLSSDGPGAVVTHDGQLVLRGFQAQSTDGLLWAECASGAQVQAWGVTGQLPVLPCVERLGAPPRLGPP